MVNNTKFCKRLIAETKTLRTPSVTIVLSFSFNASSDMAVILTSRMYRENVEIPVSVEDNL